MTTGTTRPASIWAALATVYVVWGSTYLAIRVVVEADIPPLAGMGTRFLVAGTILAAFIAFRHGPARLRVSARELRGAAFMGIMLLVFGNGVVAIAEQTVPSGLTALIVAAIPLWFVLFRVAGGERPRTTTWFGVLIGLGGVAGVSLPRGGLDGVETWGILLLILAPLSWATGSYLSPRLGLPRDALVTSAYEMLVAGAVMTTVSVISGEAADLDVTSVPARGWIALAYLVLIGSLLGYTAYSFALAHAPLSLVGTYAYVNPVVAVLLGWAILDETVTSVVVGGGALVIGGVALVVSGERPAGPAGPRRRRETAGPAVPLKRARARARRG
ncbi:drug/metabolite transporter (DMT)-like permease [Haloactinopolyspora alba]|uniref:Drug/metabolite transporter (DMT)-like permease n=1 Tax=Haloactinopolyspora alba TaxID=648780 RepID=A0A2P8EFY2_9ACTN|nr:EamA family transporter [Haloactinopolyspora alba]PSL08362.1 drug/metabolite transporter (DMT)-like permease [Haloactinopolyspora alba]